MIPAAATAAVTMLCSLAALHWPQLDQRQVLAAQIEKETCVSLKNSKCYTPRAELKTAREYGFNYGQITVTAAFNNFNAVVRSTPALARWQWADRLDGTNGLIALLSMDRAAFGQCASLVNPGVDTYSCMLSVYNGGFGGFRSDRRLCANTKGCDPRVWAGNVELTSTKAKKPASGYGQSFYQINRGYVSSIMGPLSKKYQPLVEEVCRPQ